MKRCECGEETKYFHSGCCNAHFEGRIVDDKYIIVCEECGSFVGELKSDSKK